MNALPYFKLYPNDLTGVPGWALVGNEAMGVYFKLLLYMWHGTPRGYLTLGNHVPDESELAAIVAADRVAMGNLLAILSRASLVARDDHGRLYCPWLVTQAEALHGKHQKQVEGGKRGAAKRWPNASNTPQPPPAAATAAPPPAAWGGHRLPSGLPNGLPIACQNQKTDAEVREVFPPLPLGNTPPAASADPAPERRQRERFTPPTAAEVAAYVAQQGYAVDAQLFVDHYTSNGWLVGRNPMRNWQAAVRTWQGKSLPALGPGAPVARPVISLGMEVVP